MDTPTGVALVPASLIGPSVDQLLRDIEQAQQPAATELPPQPAETTPAGANGVRPKQVPPALGRTAAPNADTPAPKANDLAGTKAASFPITTKLATQAVHSDAGKSVCGTVTVTKQLDKDISAYASFGVRVRDPSDDGRPSQLQLRFKSGVTYIVYEDARSEAKVGANGFTDVTLPLDGESPLRTEYGFAVQGDFKYSLTKDFSAQVKLGAQHSWTSPGGTSATTLSADGSVTYKPRGSDVSLGAGIVGELTLPGEGPPSSASSLYGSVLVPVSKGGTLGFRANLGLDGNGSSQANSEFTSRDGGLGFSVNFTQSLR
jgi:hypothetical protein